MYEYGTDAFAKLACMRPVYLQTFLDLGYSVVWSDMDSVWLHDFMQEAPRVRTLAFGAGGLTAPSDVHSLHKVDLQPAKDCCACTAGPRLCWCG